MGIHYHLCSLGNIIIWNCLLSTTENVSTYLGSIHIQGIGTEIVKWLRAPSVHLHRLHKTQPDFKDRL